MTDPESRRGRTHDAVGARQAILNAAEEIFAKHGFDGARIDAIAAASTYNKSLIFQYFEDKLGLYAAVIRRVDDQTRGIQTQILNTVLEDETFFDKDKFRTVLKTYLRAYFDYLVQHPRITRIFHWEMAEGWQTYAKIVSEQELKDIDQFMPILEKMRSTGLMRSDFEPILQVILVELFIPCCLATTPLYQLLLPNADYSSNQALTRLREYIIEFVVHGLLADDVLRTPGSASKST